MKLLITGATGFVGRNILLEALQQKQYEKIYLPVRSLAKLKEQLAQEGFATLPSVIHPIESSATQWNLGEAVTSEHVIHSAGVIFARTRDEYWDTNVEGTVRLLRELKKPEKIVILSSLAAAGPSEGETPKKEGDSDSPVTWYGRSKMEMEHRLAKEFPHMPYICLRPPMIFGPRDSATLPLFKMVRKPIHFKAALHTKYYSFVSVEDLVAAIFMALSKPFPPGKHTYYIAHDTVVTDRELLKAAAEACGRPSRVLPVPQWALKVASRMIDTIPTWRATIPTLSVDRAKEIWPQRWVASAEAFERDFDWTARTSFGDSLKSTREWYVQSGQL